MKLQHSTLKIAADGVIYEVRLSNEDGYHFHAFEVSHEETDQYEEGGLKIETLSNGMEILTDYDGVSILPLPVALALEKHGVGFAPFVFPVELI